MALELGKPIEFHASLHCCLLPFVLRRGSMDLVSGGDGRIFFWLLLFLGSVPASMHAGFGGGGASVRACVL